MSQTEVVAGRHPAAVSVRGRHPISRADLRIAFDWGQFPRNRRRHYLAQRGRCPYCGEIIPLIGHTWDHVWPKSRGGTNLPENKVLAHGRCNVGKGDRRPFACERLYANVTHEIALALIPKGEKP